MAGPGDAYRLKAADMLARAEQNALFRRDFENLAKAFLRLAGQADRNSQLGWPLSEALEEQQPQQQQQQVQPKDKATE